MQSLRLSVFRLEALIIAVALALLATAVASQILFDRNATLERGMARAESDSRLISEHASVVFQTADRILQGTMETIGNRPLDEVAASGEFREILRQFATDLVNSGSVSILDRNGRLVLTTSPAMRPGTNFADREYFQALARGAARYIGRVADGRARGTPIVIISRPIGSGESFRGVVTVGMQAQFFSDFYSSIMTGPVSSVTLMRTDGALLAHQSRTGHEGPSRASPALPADVNEVIDLRPSSVDGSGRIAALRRVPQQPLLVSTSIATDTVLGAWRRRSIALGGLGLLTIGLLAALTFVALRAAGREHVALQETRKLTDELAVALKRERTMRREQLHRTKNNLAMMIAMLQVEGRRPHVDRDAFLGTANRITALALAQQSLDQATEGDIDCAGYLRNLATVLAETESNGRVRLDLSLEPIMLPAERAQALGLITNELITNSIKHAFHNRPTGTVTLKLRTEGDDVLFEYADNGSGFRGPGSADSKGLGLIRTLCGTLRGRYTESGHRGMRFHLSFPRSEPDEAHTMPIPESAVSPGRTRSDETSGSRVAQV
jgi:two-component sensor histidine kinase